jgi:hypothetical protein
LNFLGKKPENHHIFNKYELQKFREIDVTTQNCKTIQNLQIFPNMNCWNA